MHVMKALDLGVPNSYFHSHNAFVFLRDKMYLSLECVFKVIFLLIEVSLDRQWPYMYIINSLAYCEA